MCGNEQKMRQEFSIGSGFCGRIKVLYLFPEYIFTAWLDILIYKKGQFSQKNYKYFIQ
jgi:hypothetical protein